MFDKLVVSSLQRRKHTAAKYFFGTGALYVIAIASAFCASVLMSDPKLADTSTVVTLIGPSLPPALGGARGERGPRRQAHEQAQNDPRRVRSLDDILRQDRNDPPAVPPINPPGDGIDVGSATDLPGSGGLGRTDGVQHGDPTVAPPPRPDPPRPKPATQTTAVSDNRPMRLPSSILQGKAIERRKPIYPQLAQQIRLQGDVSVEVMIAPDGHVESGRVVSGHPMLARCSLDAAMGWRFQPTLLNSVPVRVTGVIVFVFKLNE